jgi:hypothetical protein
LRWATGLPTATINEVLLRRCDEQLEQAVSALDADLDLTGTLLMATPESCWPANLAASTCW